MSATVYYKIHLHSSDGERDAFVSIVSEMDNGFYKVREKGTNKTYMVFRHKLLNAVRKQKKHERKQTNKSV